MTLAFITTSALILLTPGPTNTLLAASGATLGLRRAAPMPIAEAIGYAVAISLLVLVSQAIQGHAALQILLRLAAAGWLLYSACRLWSLPFTASPGPSGSTFMRVLLTTMINPKALLVGTVLIPTGAEGAPLWIATYVALSVVAGFGWVLLGSLLPLGLRRHAYKTASVILGGFSIAVAAQALA
ncbi:threonine transporter [Rhizobium sp. LjRoot30]|uniref:LysE family translocator n=1 Tax=Rhizobium sp. LjRoot30 TaxID=3342320 RepID=UPI003ECD184B